MRELARPADSLHQLEYHEPVECRTRLLTRDMPVVKVDFDGRTCLLVLPRRSSSGVWAWDELRVVPSPLSHVFSYY